MKNKGIALMLMLTVLLANSSVAQNVFVYDQQSGNPVYNVVVTDKSGNITALTNKLGIVDIGSFRESSEIIFSHPSYDNISFTNEQIKSLKFKVPLTEKLINLNEVIVSASSWETKANEIPNEIEQITRKEISFENPQTSADMLSKGNQVYVQKSQLGGGSPMLRGFAANRILLQIDGVRMNNAIYRSGNLQNVLQADVNSVENTEVIFGPGTNIYGSDALGGVIDIHMFDAKFSNTSEVKTSGNALARVSTADFERTINAHINIANDSWAWMASVTYSDFDDLKMGSMHNDYNLRPEYVDEIDGHDSIVQNDDPEIQRFSGYSQLTAMTKIANKVNDNINWSYNLYFTRTSEVPRYDRLTEYSNGHLKYAKWYYYPQKWLMNSVNINMNNGESFYDNASITLAYQNLQEGRDDRKYQDEWLRKRTETLNIFSLNADFDLTLSPNNFLYYGLEADYNNVQSAGIKENIVTFESKPTSSRYPDGGTDYLQSGAYITYKRNFKKSPLTFLGGVRFSYVYLDSKFDDTTYYNLPYKNITLSNGAFTGNAGIVYHPKDWQLKLNLSSGFRAPNLDDVAKIFDSEPGNVVVPNENLKPEYLYNADISILRNINDVAKIEFSAFYSYLYHAMVRRDFTLNGQDSIMYDGEMSKVQAVVNAGSANVYGASILLKLKLINHLAFNGTATYIKGEDDEHEPLRHAPPVYGGADLTYDYNRLKVVIGVDFNGEISYNNMAPSERSKPYMYATDANGNPYSPGWWTLNFNSSYAFNEKFIASLAVENILDYRYRTYSSGIAAPGRNFIIALRYSF